MSVNDATADLKKRTDLYDDKEATEYTNLSARTLWQLRANRLIAFIKLGRKIYYEKADLDAYIASQRREVLKRKGQS